MSDRPTKEEAIAAADDAYKAAYKAAREALAVAYNDFYGTIDALDAELHRIEREYPDE